MTQTKTYDRQERQHLTRVLQKQGISGLLNICTIIKHCAKFEHSHLEALPSQSPKTLVAMRRGSLKLHSDLIHDPYSS